MTNLTTTFTPIYKKTGLADYRFNDDVTTIFKSVDSQTIEGLVKFAVEKNRIEIEYGRYAFRLAIAFLKHINEIDSNEKWDSSTNYMKWRSKGLLKTLRKGLQELGFKPANVSTVIGAASYVIHICPSEYNPDLDGTEEDYSHGVRYYQWVRGLDSISSIYELARTDLLSAYSSAMGELVQLSNGFKDKVSRDKIKDLRKRHPINLEEGRGQTSTKSYPEIKVVSDDVSTSTEQITYETQADIQNNFFMCLELMDLDEAYADPQFMERLRSKSHEIETLKSWLPNRLKPTLSTMN